MTPHALRDLIGQQDIVYRVAGTRWDEALPMGDGCFGAMQYEENGAFQWTLNHLDLYHAPLDMTDYPVPTHDLKEMARKAEAAHRDPSNPAHQNYSRVLSPGVFTDYGWKRRGVWMNIAGRLQIRPRIATGDAVRFEQRLDLFNASVETRCRWKKGELRLRSFVARGSSTLVIEVEASNAKLLDEMELLRCPSPHRTGQQSGTHGAEFWIVDTFKPIVEKLSRHVEAAVCGRIVNRKGTDLPIRARTSDTGITWRLPRNTRRFTILLTVAVDEPNRGVLDVSRATLRQAQSAGVGLLQRNHERHWHSFWEKSQIELADKFLEKLWYVNLYALASSDGAGTRWKAQATGLNGLWDIKNPDGWGSSWYWDVNIQEAYWGCYTANHLEMTQPFNDGLREYVPAARRWAREFYKMRGLAADFPFPLYHCIWPWCCQFLWWGYRYSMDENFLRDVAYPIMREVLMFFEDFLQRDAKGKYFAFPTVSPEQGPLTKNATILLASLRYLLQAGIDASRVLKVDGESRSKWTEILNNLADFPTGMSAQFGETFKDSDWANSTLYLAHPSPLMTVYPTALIGLDSPRHLRELARNTLKYADTLQALGTFNFGWLSACASRLGLGDEGARLIYEKGVAFLLRPNGLMTEETDRFIHNCHVLSDPLYLPPMSECSGGMLGAINEMLLSSRDGKVRVFPAIPKSWRHARFNNLLAEGALEVSAEYRDGKTVQLRVHSLKGGSYRLVVNGKTMAVRLKAGAERQIVRSRAIHRVSVASPRSMNRTTTSGVSYYITPTKRRVFLGKDSETEYRRKLDDFLFDYNVGDIAVPKQTKYKFDFGPSPAIPKKYASVIPQQLFNNNKIGPDFYRIHPDTIFTPLLRYGWEKKLPLRATDRKCPDDLRRDFISGNMPAHFCIELPRGQYQLLFLAGDAASETTMSIEVSDQFRWQTRQPLRAGQVAIEVLPVRMVEDGILKIRMAGKQNHSWKLNMLMVNRVS